MRELYRAIWLEVRWRREQYRYWPNRRFFAEQNANSIRHVWKVEGI